ncbi:hypothetical protein [Nocardia fluminea]|uniref:DUF8020 domain-containing protein n=1 Tax=Nocardia fluminea TaxID=134984 RepID=A0A2N3WY49_9NOCA|nr:hypothetical protein [Nocardia fluminea]PKV98796.1 hypothetical protein ATK86_0824 [Nocardia fluminea]
MHFSSRTTSGVQRFGAIAVLAAGAVGLAATAQAAPAAAAPIVQGVDNGVAFTASPLADGSGLTVSAPEGTFRVAGGAVTLTNREGNVVAAVPTRIITGAGDFDLVAGISADGRSATLTPTAAPAVVTANMAEFVDAAGDTEARKQHNAGIGALIGAGIGAVLGFFLGGVGALVTIPIGAGIGALIGYSTP